MNVNLNIHLGFYVAWEVESGAFAYAISGLYGPRKVQYFDAITIENSTPVTLSLLGLNHAILDAGTDIKSNIDALKINIYTSTKNYQALNALRSACEGIKMSVAVGRPAGIYNSVHRNLYGLVEQSGLNVFGNAKRANIKVNKPRDDLAVPTTCWKMARRVFELQSPTEQKLSDVIDLQSRRSG